MNNSGLIFAIGSAITWGLVYNLDQKILTKTSLLGMFFLSSLITMIVTLPFVLYQWESLKPVLFLNNKQFLSLFVVTQLMVILAEFLMFSSIRLIGAPVASIFEFTAPLFVGIFALLLFGGSLNMYFWAGAILMFLGGIIITKFG